jgi:uncharacterized protein Yka (UPF0111/DUF47 family)
MLKLFRAVMPKEVAFFDMFERHSETLVGGAEVMSRMFAKEEGIQEACRQISQFEEQADEVTREVLHGVRRTFITPFDRSAITDLISSMDDAIDEMQKTAKAITQFEVAPFRAADARHGGARRAGREAGGRGDAAAAQDRQQPPQAGRDHRADRPSRGGCRPPSRCGPEGLFLRHRDGNAMGYIVGREIYSHLEKVLDRLEDVANEISGVVIDHA